MGRKGETFSFNFMQFVTTRECREGDGLMGLEKETETETERPQSLGSGGKRHAPWTQLP